MMHLLSLAGLLVSLVSVQAKCGVERWSVKTGTDPDNSKVDTGDVKSETIYYLTGVDRPPSLPSDGRVAPIETTVFEIHCTITFWKHESDKDYHIVASDSSGRTMITEIPDPSCVGDSSPFYRNITAARKTFDDYFNTKSNSSARVLSREGQAASKDESSSSDEEDEDDAPGTLSGHDVKVPAIIRGIGFFDFLHGQTGVAPNGMELHPVLYIDFPSP
eukprot:TRINITY_DN46233_c0_g1_i1.p2 TRINITY_DN46233_c0_g1~~TRINITY_DN46233_c0_g1_i1.p2  ORF type:complete len:218 (-),score=38.35 TRINITY_DN46233_c0_g1_i1:210-863(-)